jgi:hypothetical protein
MHMHALMHMLDAHTQAHAHVQHVHMYMLHAHAQ